MLCENCNKQHNGSYGSGRFCNKKCARSFSTKNVDKVKKAVCPECGVYHQIKKRAQEDKTLCTECKKEKNTCVYCGRKARYTLSNGKRCCSKNHQTCPAIKYKNAAGVSKAHIDGRCSNKGIDYTKIWNKGKLLSNPDTIFIKYKDKVPKKDKIRKYLIAERGIKCEVCGRTEWNGIEIVVETHHKSCDRLDNTRENLQLLCPNCHAQTPGWRGRKTKMVV